MKEMLEMKPEKSEGFDPCVARLKERLLTAPYEVCMARALHFTRSYKETEGMDPHLRNALALKRTLEKQKIFIYPDEYIAGTMTEKFLAGPLSIERGDFLRILQMEMDILHLKHRPFLITEEEKEIFWNEIVPYWDGRTVRDFKAREWEKNGLIEKEESLLVWLRGLRNRIRFLRYVGRKSLRKIMGANRQAPMTLKRFRTLRNLRYELANNNPNPAVYCFDVQGHLSLGVDRAIAKGMDRIIAEARAQLKRLERSEPDNLRGQHFLEAVIISLEAAIHYSERFADLAETMAAKARDAGEKRRLEMIAENCRRVPRNRPTSFHEAIQSLYMTLLVGTIQYGTHEVFAVGRTDQYLYPFYKQDIESGRITRDEAKALLQELFLKLEANVEPIPEVGMETNAPLGNSQHVVTIGGLTPEGKDGTNDLSMLILDAFEEMNGAINQLSVRIHNGSPDAFVRRTMEVFRKTNGIAIHNDEATIAGMLADGLSPEDARDYVIVGCIETSGQSDTHGCVGGHEIVLPAILLLTLSRGAYPPPFIGQQKGYDSGDLAKLATFKDFMAAFKRQLSHQVKTLVRAVAGKDKIYMDILPAPYVSAFMDDCIEKAADITAGGARYDFTSLDVRGMATLIDCLLAIRTFVYEKKELTLTELIKICDKNFKGHEVLRQRLIHEAPKFGVGNDGADAMALQVLKWFYEESSKYRNFRNGRFRMCYYSYGNHVIDGFTLGATPDGRLRGEPLSNGVSPSNLVEPIGGVTGPMRSVAKFPPSQISSGISLNMRFYPNFIKTDQGLDTFTSMIRTYFKKGGMHIQPNVVSTETLRDAQLHPERYRDLIVKVSGYSAFFTDLGKSIQEDIIARTEFGR